MEGLANIAYSDAYRTLLAGTRPLLTMNSSRLRVLMIISYPEFAAATEKQLTPQLEKIVQDISLVGVTWFVAPPVHFTF
jgi:hypothetical protein